MKFICYPCSMFCLMFVLTALSGCGAVQEARKAAGRQQFMNQLKQVGLAFHAFHDKNQRAPNNWEELQSTATNPAAVQEVRNAGYEFLFGVSMRDATIGSGNCILAHKPADVATGGDILMMDGAVMNMTAEQLKEALDLRATMKKP